MLYYSYWYGENKKSYYSLFTDIGSYLCYKVSFNMRLLQSTVHIIICSSTKFPNIWGDIVPLNIALCAIRIEEMLAVLPLNFEVQLSFFFNDICSSINYPSMLGIIINKSKE